MKLLSKRTALRTALVGAAILTPFGLTAALGFSQLGFFAAPDPSALWSWSLHSWESTALGPSGETIRIAHEPLALGRNLAVISLALVGLLLSAPRIAELFAGSETRKAPPTDAVAATRRQLDVELNTILTLVRSHLETNKSYSAALAKGQKDLTSASASPDQVRAAIVLLIAENQKMLRETEEYERSLEEARQQISDLRAALAATQELNVRDSLTQVYTRRHFDATLAQEVSEAHEKHETLSLVMADIDHFKKINDAYGHPIGDEVLKNFARTMSKQVQDTDTVARYGGEEFGIILPGAGLEAATLLAERIRAEFENKKWAIKGGGPPIGRITASFGVAELQPGESAANLIQRADEKLYVSKSGGRNRVSNGASTSR